MARTAIKTLQTIWDCRWSRPGYRVIGVEDHLQPEKLWVCVRRGERCGVTEEECELCPHWEAFAGADQVELTRCATNTTLSNQTWRTGR